MEKILDGIGINEMEHDFDAAHQNLLHTSQLLLRNGIVSRRDFPAFFHGRPARYSIRASRNIWHSVHRIFGYFRSSTSWDPRLFYFDISPT